MAAVVTLAMLNVWVIAKVTRNNAHARRGARATSIERPNNPSPPPARRERQGHVPGGVAPEKNLHGHRPHTMAKTDPSAPRDATLGCGTRACGNSIHFNCYGGLPSEGPPPLCHTSDGVAERVGRQSAKEER